MLEESLLVSSITNEQEGTSSILDDNKDNNNLNDKQYELENVQHHDNECRETGKNVIIHVCDESRNMEKSFECNKQLLIEKMTYFRKYLASADQDEEEEVDISVHCDILVFEWLIQYISSKNKPQLEIHNVVSILISSHFLQMNLLVNECIYFTAKHLNDIIQLPLDLSCLSDEIVQKISEKLNILTVDLLNDPSDKIISRLYRHQIELFIKKKDNKLFHCVYCGELYTKQQRTKLICYKSPGYINFHGDIIRKHCAQRGWYINKYLLGLRLQHYSWKSIYWHLWSITRAPVFCHKCTEYITVPHLYHCAFHTKEPLINPNNTHNTLLYPCCQTKENKFEIIQTQTKGCEHKQHQITALNNSEQDEDKQEMQEILNIISTHSQYTLVPFECSSSCCSAAKNKRPQSADPRSRLLKHSSRFTMNQASKRFPVNSPSKVTGVWDKRYFAFGSQHSSKAIQRTQQNNLDVYHQPNTFWYNEPQEENRDNNNNDDVAAETIEYLGYCLDDIGDEGEEKDVNHNNLLGHTEDVFTDDGSVDIEDVDDVMDFHSTQSQNIVDKSTSGKSNKKKSKEVPVRGRRLKTMNSKTRFCADNKDKKGSSAFGIQQNDIRKLEALMKSLSQNRHH